MMIELAVTAGPHAGRVFQFTEHAAFIVGRSAQAHFSLPEKDPHVSRLHFLVEVNPPLCRLRNMSRTNPTLVNGTPAREADLRDGDRITAGVTEFAVRRDGAPSEDAVPTAPLARTAPLPTARYQPGAPTGTFAPTPGPHTLPEDTLPVIPGYRIEGILGRGGMGIVYRAVHAAGGETVAVKMILPRAAVTAATLTKFVLEADVVRRLDHPGIVQFRDSGVAAGRVWFAMEFVPGKDAQAVADAGPLPAGRVVGWVAQALGALQHAHDRGFVHRDVKPANLLVTSGPGGAEVVKVADFGLARTYEASPLSGLTLTGSTGGTPAFMPPEQIRDMRSVKPPADQYAAAASLYWLLGRQHVYPPSGTVEELFSRILTTEPVPLATHRPDLPAGLTAAIHRALSRGPATRFPDCLAFANALRSSVS